MESCRVEDFQKALSMRTAAAAALFAVVLVAPALAQQLSPAPTTVTRPSRLEQPSLEMRPVEPVWRSLEARAADGESLAQFELGLNTLYGTDGRPRDTGEALSWLIKATDGGLASAAKNLAVFYEAGDEQIPQDRLAAAQWWLRAGQQGEEQAKTRFIALVLEKPIPELGGPVAAQWLEEAALAGDSRAALAAAEVYEHGQGLLVDPAKTEKWYLHAALAGSTEGQFRLGKLLLGKPGIWRVIPRDPPSKDSKPPPPPTFPDRVAAKAAAGDDHMVDLLRPGMISGERWLMEAARNGHAEAQYVLGRAYLAGVDLPFDLTKAVQWLSASAANNYGPGVLETAALTASGQGFFAKDPIRAWIAYDLVAKENPPVKEKRDALAKEMSPEQIAHARALEHSLRQLDGTH